MTLSLTIDPDTEARLLQLARAAGKDLTSYLSELLEVAARPVPSPADSAADFDRALDELFAGDQRELPSVASTYSRQDIYSDHD